MNRKFAVLAFALLALTCGAVVSAADAYRLGANDVIRVTVFGQPDLNTVARVAENGAISFPFIGSVAVAGMTAREVENKIAQMLASRDVVKSPQVGVMIESFESRRVSVLGQVANPGVYVITRGTSVMDLISQAGGLTAEAGDQAVLTRGSGASKSQVVLDLTGMEQADASAFVTAVQSGDTIFVNEKETFYVYGQVNRPGAYPLDRGLTVMQALSVAGGLTDRGTERGLKIRRTMPDGTVRTLSADLTDRLQARDVVFVKESLF